MEIVNFLNFLNFLLVFVASYWVFNYCCIYINRSNNAVEYAQVFKAKQKIQFLENNFIFVFGRLYETFNFVKSIISEMVLLQNNQKASNLHL